MIILKSGYRKKNAKNEKHMIVITFQMVNSLVCFLRFI